MLNLIKKSHQPEEREMAKIRAKALEGRYSGVPFTDANWLVIRVSVAYLVPEIWRTFRVPARITLAELHDRVLCPVMGWVRNYHAYQFRHYGSVLSTDIGWGPVKSHAIDMMFVNIKGGALADDTRVRLGQLMGKVGDRLVYLYDMGDMWMHVLRLEEIVAPDANTIIACLDGEGNCLPEDGKGAITYAKLLEALYDPSNSGHKDAVLKIHGARNIASSNFDPMHFDLKRVQDDLEAAVRTQASPLDNSGLVCFVRSTGVTGLNEDLGTTFKNPVKEREECYVCGVTVGTNRCAGCLKIWYCGEPCQVADRKRHRPECHRENKDSSENQSESSEVLRLISTEKQSDGPNSENQSEGSGVLRLLSRVGGMSLQEDRGTTSNDLVKEHEACYLCGITVGVKRCSGCLKIWYCGKPCQSADRKRHMPECHREN
mmetsp:Transcript_29371/g.47429  ORF Transcript_29371/g.47429 Transcript_29371/m.47429 type:complete len:430 (+) Transcript_29371:491-1780(+)